MGCVHDLWVVKQRIELAQCGDMQSPRSKGCIIPCTHRVGIIFFAGAHFAIFTSFVLRIEKSKRFVVGAEGANDLVA